MNSKYPFIHLRTQSSYSLAESTIKINKLLDLAKLNNMPAIALTDKQNLFGAFEFSLEAQKNGYGEYTFAHGAKYTGEYKDNMPNGYGEYTNDKGEHYVGCCSDSCSSLVYESVIKRFF